MGQGAQRWRILGLAILALLSATVTRADAPRIALYYGPAGPFAELLGAELALVGFELRPGPVPTPVDATEALALLEETEAVAILDHHRGEVALWLPRAGSVRRAVVPVADDPGIAPLVIAETLRAAVPSATEAGAAVAPAPEGTRPPPRIAIEAAPPPESASQPQPEAPPRVTLSAGPIAAYGGRWRVGLTLEASVRLHPALAVGAIAIVGGSPAAAFTLRAGGSLGRLHLAVDAGPAIWWREEPGNDGTLRLGPSPSWTAGVGAAIELSSRWALGGRVALLRAGPRHRIGEREGALTLSLTLGARF